MNPMALIIRQSLMPLLQQRKQGLFHKRWQGIADLQMCGQGQRLQQAIDPADFLTRHANATDNPFRKSVQPTQTFQTSRQNGQRSS